MAAETTDRSTQGDAERKLNRKEVIKLGFENKTKGEAAFNLISYAGFGYFVVTATSVLMTFLLQDSKKFGGMGKWLKEASVKAHLPKSFGNIASLFIGGTIASVLPVKWLEDNKPKFVKKLDHLFYTDAQYDRDPELKKAHQELDTLPNQTWLSVAGARVVAFVATLGVFLAAGSNKSPLYRMTKGKISLDKASIELGRATDKLLNKGMIEKVEAAIQENKDRMRLPSSHPDYMISSDVIRPENHTIEPSTPVDRKTSRVLSYIYLDAFYTAITSATLWVSTRVFGAMVGKDTNNVMIRPPLTLHRHLAQTSVSQPETVLANQAPPHLQETPPTKITAPVRLERVHKSSNSAELTA